MVNKLKKLLTLTDPYSKKSSAYSNLWYELFCYLKAILGTLLLVLGILLIFHPWLIRISIFGIFETGLTTRGLKIINFLGSLLLPKGYLGFFIWGLVSVILGIVFFLKIKLVRKALNFK